MDFSKLQVWKYPYSLKRVKKPNSQVSNTEQQGYLIKIQNEFGHVGYADLCPWPQFGDLTCEEQIAKRGPLFIQSLRLAYDDLIARQSKLKLVLDNTIRNNILISDLHDLIDMNQNDLGQFTNKTIKIKGDLNYLELAHTLNKLSSFELNIIFRIDFNFCIDQHQFADFLEVLTEQAQKAIEYIEDPFPFNRQAWNFYDQKIPLYLDWHENKFDLWHRLVIKPSRESSHLNLDSDKTIATLTSAMEHPVGLVHGLRWAQKYPDKVHGFATLSQYEKTDFNYFFNEHLDLLNYHSDGYGIGFTHLLSRLNWIPIFETTSKNNFLLSGHRLSVNENEELFKIKQHLEEKYNIKDCLLIPSSGSTQKENESVKIIVLKQDALIQSALRVNTCFNVDQASCWGCVLPMFHVGGLGVFLRAQLAHCRFRMIEWSNFNMKWIEDNKITHLSLVPTQLFEILQSEVRCPACLKYVFIGGAHLSIHIAEKAEALGWPIIQTFGMTETASMIAVKNSVHSDYFELLPGIEIKSIDQKMCIRSNSNAMMSAKYIRDTENFEIEHFNEWLQTQDEVCIQENTFKFLQRNSDFIKIKGEGVSLFEMRNQLIRIMVENKLNYAEATICDFADDRDGHVMRLVISEKLSEIFVPSLLEKFNKSVRPYEKIQTWIQIPMLPKTDLNKIKFAEIKKIRNVNVKKI